MEGQDISKQIGRRTLRCTAVQRISANIIAVSGEFGVNTFECITLEIKEFVPTDKERPMTEDERREYNKLYYGLQNFWKTQEGKTYKELESLIKEKGGNAIQLRQFKFEELQRLNQLIEKYHRGEATEADSIEATKLDQLRRDSFGIRGTLIVPTKILESEA
jgi:hypothetical protein